VTVKDYSLSYETNTHSDTTQGELSSPLEARQALSCDDLGRKEGWLLL
jgi:hypothetical protein